MDFWVATWERQRRRRKTFVDWNIQLKSIEVCTMNLDNHFDGVCVYPSLKWPKYRTFRSLACLFFSVAPLMYLYIQYIIIIIISTLRPYQFHKFEKTVPNLLIYLHWTEPVKRGIFGDYAKVGLCAVLLPPGTFQSNIKIWLNASTKLDEINGSTHVKFVLFAVLMLFMLSWLFFLWGVSFGETIDKFQYFLFR